MSLLRRHPRGAALAATATICATSVGVFGATTLPLCLLLAVILWLQLYADAGWGG